MLYSLTHRRYFIPPSVIFLIFSLQSTFKQHPPFWARYSLIVLELPLNLNQPTHPRANRPTCSLKVQNCFVCTGCLGCSAKTAEQRAGCFFVFVQVGIWLLRFCTSSPSGCLFYVRRTLVLSCVACSVCPCTKRSELSCLFRVSNATVRADKFRADLITTPRSNDFFRKTSFHRVEAQTR